MPTQHQQLLTTLEDIAKKQADKYFPHPVHRTVNDSEILYQDEAGFNDKNNLDFLIWIDTRVSDRIHFHWGITKDNTLYGAKLSLCQNECGDFYCRYYDEFYSYNWEPYYCHKRELLNHPIFADFRNALKPIKDMLED